MKVSVILFATLLSWAVAYPGLLDLQKDVDKPIGNVVTGKEKREVTDDTEGKKEKEEGGPFKLFEDIKSWGEQFLPLHKLNNEALGQLGIPNLLQKQDNEGEEDFKSPIAQIFGKHGLIASLFSKATDTAKKVVEVIKDNFKPDKRLPFPIFGKILTGSAEDADKSDSDRPKGYESHGDDNSQISAEVERSNTWRGKEGHVNSYQEPAEGGWKEGDGEKHAIHSSGSQAWSQGDAKTGGGEKKAAGRSQVSTGQEEKSADARKQNHPTEEVEKKSLTSVKGESSASMNVDKKVAAAVDEKKDDHPNYVQQDIEKTNGDVKWGDHASVNEEESARKESSRASKDANGKASEAQK